MLSEIANHLWQSTLFAAVIAVFVRLLRDHGAHVRYWLWWAASVKFLVPFSLLSMLGGLLAGTTRPVYVFTDWTATFERLVEPVPASAGWSAVGVVLLGAWACGFAAVLCGWLVRRARLGAVVRAAAPWPSPPIRDVRAPAIRCTDAHVEPGMVGIFRPVLLLPRGIAAHLTREQLDAVLAHELCHWRRHDNLTAAVHTIVEAVVWFHPLVWWLGARLLDEREHACDEAVVRAGHDREAYAEGILNVCELYVASSLPGAAGVGGADLKKRVVRIVKGRAVADLGFAWKLVLAVTVLACVGLPIAFGVSTPALAQVDDSRLIPLVRIAPTYPPEALAARLEAEVVLEFTIAADGTTRDIVVVSSTSPLFEAPAAEALRRWRYAPRLEGDQAVDVPGVRTMIRFQLD